MRLCALSPGAVGGDVMAMRTAYPDNPVMAMAFASFLRFSAEHADTLDAFRNATGITPFWAERRTPLDAMVDSATDRERRDVDAFVDWLIENVWGESPWGAQ